MQQFLLPTLSHALRQRRWLVAAREELRELLPRLTGYRFLQIGRCGPLARSFRAALCAPGSRALFWVLDQVGGIGVDVLADTQRLPLADASVDAVMLPFSLEAQQRPHPLLREVDRVLSARGQLIVFASNPLNPKVAWRQFRSLTRERESARALTARRLQDWLSLLDYEVEVVRNFAGLQSWRQWRGMRWLGMFAPAYVMMARKRSMPLTPARAKPKVLPRIHPVPVPSARTARTAAPSPMLPPERPGLRRIK